MKILVNRNYIVPRILVLVAALSVFAIHSFCQKATGTKVVFSKSIKITMPIFEALNRAPDFKDCYEFAHDRTNATRLDVNGDGKQEVLVQIGCGNSSSTYSYWLLTRMGAGYTSIFNVATQSIYIQKKSRHGMRNILALGCTANTCFFKYFSFTGHSYKRTRYVEQPVP